MSGWQGSFSSHVLNHLGTFGIVNKTVQGTTGCGGLSQYPKTGKIPKKSMPLPSYHANSESLTDNNISWTSLLDRNEFIRQERNPQATLESVKQALRQHDRLVFGVFLFGLNDAPVGASGRHKQANDTWVVTSAIIDEVNQGKEPAGHAMIITGFDDYATAIDQDGVWHQGLLTLRNSWSKDAGDNGNFYMSYDYFKPLTAEIIRIRSLDSASS
jgi:aminopeptidase C